MHLYKYLPPVWAEKMLRDGAVRIGTLYDFRRIEALDSERGDQHEGVRISLTDGEPGIVEGKDLPWFVRESLKVPPNVKIMFDKGAVLNVHQNSPDAYVYCTCSTYDKSLLELFGGACVKINDSSRFFHALTQALDGWNEHGIRRISGFRLSPCEYGDREQTWPNVVSYDPVFRKPVRYSHQCEVRAVWTTPAMSIGPLNLVVPGIRRWCERVVARAA
jgi:hypothetical protein